MKSSKKLPSKTPYKVEKNQTICAKCHRNKGEKNWFWRLKNVKTSKWCEHYPATLEDLEEWMSHNPYFEVLEFVKEVKHHEQSEVCTPCQGYIQGVCLKPSAHKKTEDKISKGKKISEAQNLKLEEKGMIY
jgi:hypothetical protein